MLYIVVIEVPWDIWAPGIFHLYYSALEMFVSFHFMTAILQSLDSEIRELKQQIINIFFLINNSK